MVIKIINFTNVKEGLEQRVNDTDDQFEFEGNTSAFYMDVRIGSNEWISSDESVDVFWATFLDSRTMVLYGGKSQTYDNRYVFKIDHEFLLSTIASSKLQFNGAISINDDTYNSSTGTEFIIINKKDIKWAEDDFAIRANKYGAIKEQLGKSITVGALTDAGGFKINKSLYHYEVISYNQRINIDETALTQNDVTYIHDGWLELAVGKNRAALEDYQRAIARLAKYTKKAEKMNCFGKECNGRGFDGKAMGLYIGAQNAYLELRPLYISSGVQWSLADGWSSFHRKGCFLKFQSA